MLSINLSIGCLSTLSIPSLSFAKQPFCLTVVNKTGQAIPFKTKRNNVYFPRIKSPFAVGENHLGCGHFTQSVAYIRLGIGLHKNMFDQVLYAAYYSGKTYFYSTSSKYHVSVSSYIGGAKFTIEKKQDI